MPHRITEFLLGAGTKGFWQRGVIGGLVMMATTAILVPALGFMLNIVKPANPWKTRLDLDAEVVERQHLGARVDSLESRTGRILNVVELEAVIRTGSERDRARAFMQLRDAVRPRLVIDTGGR